jgi:hypothetical protein
MKEMVNILTPNGEGLIENIFISELGFLMLKVKNKNNTWTTYNLGLHDPNNNVFTKLIYPNRWLYQFIKSDKLWYLSEHHPTDGVLSELFFETKQQLLTYTTEHNITLEMINND